MTPTEEKEDRIRLLALIKSRAVEMRNEGFTLASGKKSNLYVDLRRITQNPEGINLIGRLVLAKVRELTPNARCVGGLETGSIPIATAVSMLSLQGRKSNQCLLGQKKTQGSWNAEQDRGQS